MGQQDCFYTGLPLALTVYLREGVEGAAAAVVVVVVVAFHTQDTIWVN
jgi:hypothetical protein